MKPAAALATLPSTTETPAPTWTTVLDAADPDRLFSPATAIPLYFQIAQIIASEIHHGRIKPGQPIPGASALARIHHVSVPTASHSIRWLRARGHIVEGSTMHTWLARPESQLS